MSGIERGVRAPTIITVEQIAKALGTSAGSLLDTAFVHLSDTKDPD